MPYPADFCPEFSSPPTVETVLGVQFEPLRGFRSGHYGWFWRDHLAGLGFNSLSDEKPLPNFVEAFGDPKLKLTRQADTLDSTAVRMKARTPDRGRTVQLQPDKLYYSWNRLNNSLIRYADVKPDFLALVGNLNEFVANASLGPVGPNLWEIHYVNQIPQGRLWQEPRDWHRVLPTLFPTADPSVDGVRFATYAGEWHFEIEPECGRVHVKVAKMVLNQETTPVLYLSLLARGEIGGRGAPDLESGLELGHKSCVQLFMALTSPKAHTEWGLKT